MEDDITYTSKANRNLTQPKHIIPGLKKESKPSGASIPNAFLRKVHFMEKYPQSLRDYIRKCFAQCTDEKSRDIVSTKLMDTINSVSGDGNINQHNWNAHPLVTPVEKEPTPPPSPPPPPPTESFNHLPNRPIQAFSSTFMAQQQPPPMMQGQQSYNYPPTLQQPYGNYQYGQPPPPPPNSLMPPPPIQPMMQPNFQNNNNYQYNNEQTNYNNPYQVKNQPFFQNQGRISNQNSYQNYDYKPLNNNINNSNTNNEYQYTNNQYQPKNAAFNSNYSNPYEYNQPKRQELSSFAPGQTFPKGIKNQTSPPPLTSQLVSSQATQFNKSANNQTPQQNNFNSNPIGNNQQPFPGKGKKKKKNKKNKFNQQQNQSFVNDNNNNDELNTSSTTISSSRQRVSHLQEENVLAKSIVGTSTNLEKEYLRIAGDVEIDPSTVRPLPVLKESLQFCLDKYHNNNNYEYISEQLRSIRQDLSVQHIEDPFNVEVYETHGKLAILNRDWGNFNQSMGQLEILYPMNLGKFENICEFWKYRIIYLVGIDDNDGLCSFIPKIDKNVIESNDIQFALKIWKLAQSGEWMKFFSIMKKQNPLVAGVMSLKAQSLRISALSCTCRTFRNLTLADYRTFLCFEENEDDLLRQFLIEYEIEVPEK